MWFLSMILVALLILHPIVTGSDHPTTTLNGGTLEGKYLISRSGRNYEAYLGIRYGTIPERFEDSIATSDWTGPKNATVVGSICAQPFLFLPEGFHGDEDCLYLNVYTPKADKEKRPVIVLIHGGGYQYGSGEPNVDKAFLDQQVVIVSINYRLGILGFLNFGGRGNGGLKDQVLGLKWVQKNIEHFGGDASRVTIQGDTGGGACVTLLVLSPLAKGLFHRAVAESGTFGNPWAYRENSNEYASNVGKKLGCSEDIEKCLKDKTVAEILGAQKGLAKWFVDPLTPFPPTLETKSARNPHPFLEESPADILKSGKFNPVPILFTAHKDEGIPAFALPVLHNEHLQKDMDQNWDRVAPIAFYLEDDPVLSKNMKKVTSEIRKFYFGEDEINLEKLQDLANLYSDRLFLNGIYKNALEFSKYTQVYVGLITHQRSDSQLGGLALFTPGKDIDEALKELMENQDPVFSKAILNVFTSFAESGSPTISWGNSPKWPPATQKEVSSGTLNWFDLGQKPSVLTGLFQERMKFWTNLYQETNKSSKHEL